MAGEVLMSISKDERERAIFRNRRIAMADRESDRVTAERNMIMAERRGRTEERLSIAKSLLSVGDSIDKIVSVTGLTRDEVESLRDAD